MTRALQVIASMIVVALLCVVSLGGCLRHVKPAGPGAGRSEAAAESPEAFLWYEYVRARAALKEEGAPALERMLPLLELYASKTEAAAKTRLTTCESGSRDPVVRCLCGHYALQSGDHTRALVLLPSALPDLLCTAAVDEIQAHRQVLPDAIGTSILSGLFRMPPPLRSEALRRIGVVAEFAEGHQRAFIAERLARMLPTDGEMLLTQWSWAGRFAGSLQESAPEAFAAFASWTAGRCASAGEPACPDVMEDLRALDALPPAR